MGVPVTAGFWLCAEGHRGWGEVPDRCPGCVNGRPCDAPCHPTTAAGHPLKEANA